jgi:sulfate permease, SulP family
LTIQTLKRDWFSNIPTDVLAGTVVALALIPEALAFSVIAGVDPKVGLYGAFIIAMTTAFFGGRSGMISAATGSMSLLMINLVKDHGLPYLLAATLLTGVLQILFGVFKLGRQMKYVPHAVMSGFVNALGILIFVAQFQHLVNVPVAVYVMAALSLAIIYILPRFTKAVPSPLVAIVLITIAAIAFKIEVPTVGDMGALPTALPFFALPQVPFNLVTLQIIFPYSITLAIVGLLESLLTAALLDDLTDTPSDKNREAKGQGIANIIAGFFGGMAGCALIGQSVINFQSGGRGRLSTFVSGVFLLLFIFVFGDWVKQMPMAALVGVMIMVSFETFSWDSLKTLSRAPRSESLVMIATVVATLLTHNLAIGVMTGVVLSTVFFSRRISKVITVNSSLNEDGTHCTYQIIGQVFFVSSQEFLESFDFKNLAARITIDLTQAHLWDQSAVTTLDKVVAKFRRQGSEVELVGLNEASSTLVNRLAVGDLRSE